MKRTTNSNVSSSTVVTNTAKTDLSQLGKMFVYLALLDLRAYVEFGNRKVAAELEYDMSHGAKQIAGKLIELGVIDVFFGAKPVDGAEDVDEGAVDLTGYLVSAKGAKLVAKYFAACADELRAGHFGKMKWDKRTKFHKALMARIA